MSKETRYYASPDLRFKTELPFEVVEYLRKLISDAGRRETGGIIFGHYTPELDRAIVESITSAPSDSKSGYTWFRRGINGLKELIAHKWKLKRYYLGEWHFHPFAAAMPSHTDISQMLRISADKKYHCPEPILLIIGGQPDIFEIRIFIFPYKQPMIELFQVLP